MGRENPDQLQLKCCCRSLLVHGESMGGGIRTGWGWGMGCWGPEMPPPSISLCLFSILLPTGGAVLSAGLPK